MADESTDSTLATVEATYGRTIPDWEQLLRASPEFGTDDQHAQLTAMLRSRFSMPPEHAEALVAHTVT